MMGGGRPEEWDAVGPLLMLSSLDDTAVQMEAESNCRDAMQHMCLIRELCIAI